METELDDILRNHFNLVEWETGLDQNKPTTSCSDSKTNKTCLREMRRKRRRRSHVFSSGLVCVFFFFFGVWLCLKSLFSLLVSCQCFSLGLGWLYVCLCPFRSKYFFLKINKISFAKGKK